MNNIVDYITEPRFKKLVSDLNNAKSEAEENEIMNAHNSINLSEEEKEKYGLGVASDLENILKVLEQDVEELKASKVREKMGEFDKAISFAYIAKNYFGKSHSWLLQRLNGSKVNGKEVHFTRSELTQLQDAIHDLGHKLSSLVLL